MQSQNLSIRFRENHKEFLYKSIPVILDNRGTKGLSQRIGRVLDEAIDTSLASEVVERELARVELLGSKPTFEDVGADV